MLFLFSPQTSQHIRWDLFYVISDLTLCEFAALYILYANKIFKACEWELAMIGGLLALSVLLMMKQSNTGAVIWPPERCIQYFWIQKVHGCCLGLIRKLLSHTIVALHVHQRWFEWSAHDASTRHIEPRSHLYLALSNYISDDPGCTLMPGMKGTWVLFSWQCDSWYLITKCPFCYGMVRYLSRNMIISWENCTVSKVLDMCRQWLHIPLNLLNWLLTLRYLYRQARL